MHGYEMARREPPRIEHVPPVPPLRQAGPAKQENRCTCATCVEHRAILDCTVPLVARGVGYAIVIHEPSQVHHTVLLGDATVIWPFSTILEGTQLGKRCVVGTCCFIGRRCQIGDDVHMHPSAALPNEAVIGHRVYIGPNVVLANDAYPFVDKKERVHRPPTIEEDAVIGANAVLLPGVVIGRGAVVGAGAVVTKDVPPFTTVAGNPARILRMGINEAGEVVG